MIWRLLAARRGALATRSPDQDHPVGEPRARRLQRNSLVPQETSGQTLCILPVQAAWFVR